MKKYFKNIYINKNEYIYYTFITQMINSIISIILIKFGFKLILLFSNQKNIDLTNIKYILLNPISFLMILLFVLIIAFLILLEFSFLFILMDDNNKNIEINVKNILAKAFNKLKNVLGFQFVFLILYIILLIPFANFGLNISILDSLYIPDFISNELYKTVFGTVIYLVFTILVIYANFRLIFVLPLMITNENIFKENIKKSLELTSKNKLKLLYELVSGTFLMSMIFGLIYTLIYYIFNILPNNIVFGSIFLTITQIMLFILTILTKIYVISLLLDKMYEKINDNKKIVYKRKSKKLVYITIIVLFLINIFTLYKTDLNENILVIAHRTDTKNACENSLTGIVNAAKKGADMCEIDIQMTKDGKFIVMHDLNLNRLSGVNKEVSHMNFDEVHNLKIEQNGFVDKIPSLDEAIQVAKDNNIKLLIEIKVNGLEDDDYLHKLYDIMKKHNILDFPVMSIDKEVITRFENMYPNLLTGYVIPIQIGDFTNKINDFYVIEDFSYSDDLARDNKVFVWTVNDEQKITKYLYSKANAIITDEVDLVMDLKKEFSKNNSYLERALRFSTW